MKTMGIREAKAHLSQVVRDAATGECCLVTDNRKPVAVIGPPPQDPVETDEALSPPIEEIRSSNAAEFRKALLGVPFPIEVDF